MVDISYGSTRRDIPFHILRYSSKKICRFSIISLCNVEGSRLLFWQTFHLIWQRRILAKVAAQCYVNGVIEILCEYLQSARRKYRLADGSTLRAAFASKATLRQNTLHPAVSRLWLPFPLNNFEILERCLKITLRLNSAHSRLEN